MSSTKRSEDSYIVHDIIPAFSQYGYPQAGNRENLKIKSDASISVGSGRSLEPDIVYYANKSPLLIVESKRKNGSEQNAKTQAISYIRFLQFSPHPPKYFATTVGRSIKFYKYFRDEKDGQIIDDSEELKKIITYEELKKLYGIESHKPILTPQTFKELFYDLASVYILGKDKKLTPAIIKNVTLQIYEFLKNQSNYVSKQPYVSLDGYHDRQLAIRELLIKYDWQQSLNEDIGTEFKNQILRAFQGIHLNQFITPSPVVSFMANLVKFTDRDRVIDFECGSGSFISAAINSGVKLENIMGIDIADLPYYVTKTYLALCFGIMGEEIDNIPIQQANGLVNHGNGWDIVISNPAGGNKYDPENTLNDLDQVYRHLSQQMGNKDLRDNPSEYALSIQQAILSCKSNGRICLILPEGFFANSQDEFLRKYISSKCQLKAIVSLPRGIFYKGTTTRTVTSGSQQANQKMSLVFCIKLSKENNDLDYPVFIASLEDKDNLENGLAYILEQINYWQSNQSLNPSTTIISAPKKFQLEPIQPTLIEDKLPLFEKLQRKIKKPKIKTATKIIKSLESLFS
ncbi:MAG: N-6 DNA methylase [Patescibacteria group bacterium]|nr:SAM-dependent methyltransferase [Patescibacteria group bacterium]